MENNERKAMMNPEEVTWFLEAGLNFAYDFYRQGLNQAFLDLGIGYTFHQMARFFRPLVG